MQYAERILCIVLLLMVRLQIALFHTNINKRKIKFAGEIEAITCIFGHPVLARALPNYGQLVGQHGFYHIILSS